MVSKSFATARRVFRDKGLAGLASASVEQLQMWWRHGELLEIGKFTGAPSSIARLDRCRFGLDSSVPENIKYLLLSGKHEKPERAALRRFLDPNRIRRLYRRRLLRR